MADFPHLKFVPTDLLVFSESQETHKVEVERLTAQILKNQWVSDPVIVASFPDNSGRFLVLEDALQIYALRSLGCAHVLAQIVEIEDECLFQIAAQGTPPPAEASRFWISPRALHLNYPLVNYSQEASLGEKNAQLQSWIQKRMANKRVRYYVEATCLFGK